MITNLCKKCNNITVNDMATFHKVILGEKVMLGTFPVKKCIECGFAEMDELAKKGMEEKLTKKKIELIATKKYSFIMVNNIKRIREEKDIVQGDIAKSLGFTEQRYGAIERDDNTPNVYLGLKLAYLLNTDIGDLFKLEVISEEFRKKLDCLDKDYNEVEGLRKLREEYEFLDEEYKKYVRSIAKLNRDIINLNKMKTKKNDAGTKDISQIEEDILKIKSDINSLEPLRNEVESKRSEVQEKINEYDTVLRQGYSIDKEDWDKIKEKYKDELL